MPSVLQAVSHAPVSNGSQPVLLLSSAWVSVALVAGYTRAIPPLPSQDAVLDFQLAPTGHLLVEQPALSLVS